MCFDRECCTNYQPFKSNKLVFLGDNTTHEIHGQGVVIVRLHNNREKNTKSFTCSQIKEFLFFSKTFL